MLSKIIILEKNPRQNIKHFKMRCTFKNFFFGFFWLNFFLHEFYSCLYLWNLSTLGKCLQSWIILKCFFFSSLKRNVQQSVKSNNPCWKKKLLWIAPYMKIKLPRQRICLQITREYEWGNNLHSLEKSYTFPDMKIFLNSLMQISMEQKNFILLHSRSFASSEGIDCLFA